MNKTISFFAVIFFIFTVFSGCSDSSFGSLDLEQVELQGTYGTRAAIAGFKATDYFWFNGEKIPLQRVDNRFHIVFSSEDMDKLEGGLAKTAGVALSNIDEHRGMMMPSGTRTRGTDEIKTASIEGYYDQIASALYHAIHWAPYFRMGDGTEVWITNLFYIELRSETDFPQLKRLTEEHAVEVIGELDFLEGWFKLATTPLSTRNALEMANLFFETGLFESSSPCLIGIGRIHCINEPLFTNGSLWHLGNNRVNPNIHINFCNLRAILPRGSSNITVAVIDTGTQPNHPDLYNVLQGWDVRNQSAPNIWNIHPHGTQVAGFIGAIPNNGRDAAGVAHGVRILPISFRVVSATDGRITSTAAEMASAIDHAINSGARVINGSWGFSHDLVTAAVRRALDRNVIVVFASGNAGSSIVSSPANSDPRILVVGAINQRGNRATFSNFGNELDIVAPGENVIALTTPSGTRSVSGTSFAAPQVAAVAAMMLSVNPSLTAQQVRDIIKRTANRNLPGVTFAITPGRNGMWNNQVGHGLVNAYATVMAAAPPPNEIVIGNPNSHDPFSRNLCRNVNHTLLAQSTRGIYDGIGSFFWHFGSWSRYITGFSQSSRGIDNAFVHFRLSNSATVQVIGVLPLSPGEPPPSDFDMPIFETADIFHAINCFGGWALPLTVEHPNPVSSILPIQINPHPQLVANRVSRNAIGLEYDIRLYDSRGNAVRQMTTDRERIELDINGLPNGNYFLHIYDGMIDAPIVQRIIIEN